jgi:hypothetical protein
VADQLSLAELAELPGKLLADLPLDRSGRYVPAPGTASVRPFPFPYRAGLAISNDCDSQSIDCLMDWHSFVNGSKPTRYGDGLGLEVGDSFWIYGGSIEPALFKGNPFDASHEPGYALPQIVELGRLGWMDTLHSFGNWKERLAPADAGPDFALYSRDQIQKGLDRLDELGIKPFVFVNHSGSPSNVGSQWGWYQRLDEPGHGLCALDLVTSFGFRYFWLDPCTQLDKFGENLDFGDEWTLQRELDRFRWFHWFRQVDAERRPHPIAVPDDEEGRREFLVGIFNRLMFPVTAREGTPILAFKRYRDIDQPVGPTVPTQVTAAKLDRLEAFGGAVIVYQHFGVFGPRGRSPTVSKPYRKRSPDPALDEQTVGTWQMIADRQRSGRLFVATQGRLLEWVWMREALRFDLDQAADRWTIALTGTDCPVRGRRAVEASELNGLAFTVPSEAPEVRLVNDGRELPAKRAPDPVHPGMDAVYLDWQPLEWPG